MSFLQALFALVSLTASLVPSAPRTQPPHGVWPIQPPSVVRGFEPPRQRWSAGHRGVDLAGAVGTRVMSSLDGTVSYVGTLAGRGVVVVDHGDTRTTYEPVIATVERGAVVGAGEEIGLLDSMGSHCFPAACLHWGWLRGATYLDPLLLVGGTEHVRLLPITPGGVPVDTRP